MTAGQIMPVSTGADTSMACAANVRFLSGSMEDIPLEDECIDVVVSNCVINLSMNKERLSA